MERKSRPPLGRRERKKQEVRRRIRRAAARLFEEKGYEAATVDEITALADVAKGTFFNYFPRKDALLLELAANVSERIEDELGPRAEWTGSRRAQLYRLFLHLGEKAHANPKLFQIIIVETTRNLWMHGDVDGTTGLRELIRDLLEEGVRAGEFGEDAEVESAIRLLEAAYVTAAIESLRREEVDMSVFAAELTRQFDIIYRGLGGAPIEEEWCGR